MRIVEQAQQTGALNSKQFRRFRLEQQASEKQFIAEEAESRSRGVFFRKAWRGVMNLVWRFMPSSVRRLRKLEQSAFERNIEDAYRLITETEILHLKLKINDFFCGMFSLLSGWLMVFEQFILERDTMTYSNGVAEFIPGKTSALSNILRAVVMILTGGLVFTIVKHYQFTYRLKQIENHGIYYLSIWHDTSLRVWFIIELIIASICLPPFVNFMTVKDFVHGRNYYSSSLIFTSISLAKSYTLFRVYMHGSTWTNAEA